MKATRHGLLAIALVVANSAVMLAQQPAKPKFSSVEEAVMSSG
jgi:hypothetical protein